MRKRTVVAGTVVAAAVVVGVNLAGNNPFDRPTTYSYESGALTVNQLRAQIEAGTLVVDAVGNRHADGAEVTYYDTTDKKPVWTQVKRAVSKDGDGNLLTKFVVDQTVFHNPLLPDSVEGEKIVRGQFKAVFNNIMPEATSEEQAVQFVADFEMPVKGRTAKSVEFLHGRFEPGPNFVKREISDELLERGKGALEKRGKLLDGLGSRVGDAARNGKEEFDRQRGKLTDPDPVPAPSR